MSSLTIKNIPAELLDELRAEAKREYRSLNGQVLKIFEEAARRGRLREALEVDHRERTARWFAELDAAKAGFALSGAGETVAEIERTIARGRE